jgi:hypothetical protein
LLALDFDAVYFLILVETIGPKDNEEVDDEYETEGSEEYGPVMFSKRCTLLFALSGSTDFETLDMGELQVYHDPSQRFRVFMTAADGSVVCDHFIDVGCMRCACSLL